MTVGFGSLFMVAALVLFIIAAILAFGVFSTHVTLLTLIGLVASGLACQVLAGVSWPVVRSPG